MTAYERGFLDKCAELGVDPAALFKSAAVPAGAGINTERIGNKLSQPSLYDSVDPLSTPTNALGRVAHNVGDVLPQENVVAPSATPAPTPATGHPRYSEADIRRFTREWPKDPSAQKIEFQPQNFFKNIRKQFLGR